MQFKIKNTTYKISFTFLALILFTLTTDQSRTVTTLFLFAVAHELVHLIFIYSFSIAPKEVAFTLLGANIKRAVNTVNNLNSEIIINASAPVFNIVTGAFFLIISCHVTKYENILAETASVNLILGIFNLIPFYTFDGGNALKYILLKHISEKSTERALTCISLVVTIAFSFISIHIFLNYQHNFSLFIMCIYMFLSIIFKKQNSLDY